MSAVLGLDCGGTTFEAGIVSSDGSVLARASRPSAERDGLAAWLDAARSCASEVAHRGDPVALGLSLPGAVDPRRRVLVDLVARLPEAAGLGLADAFAPLGLLVCADNDARAALEAERRWGIAGGVDNVVLLTVGTGVGGAALVSGRAPGGDPVLAGNQLGHITVDLRGAECVCGNRGCVERYASASALVAASGFADAKAVFDADRLGDDRAVAAVDAFCEALGVAAVNAIHAYQPDLVVIGGGVMAAHDRILPAVRDVVAARAWTIPRGRVRVEASGLAAEIGVLGGAAVAYRDRDRADG